MCVRGTRRYKRFAKCKLFRLQLVIGNRLKTKRYMKTHSQIMTILHQAPTPSITQRPRRSFHHLSSFPECATTSLSPISAADLCAGCSLSGAVRDSFSNRTRASVASRRRFWLSARSPQELILKTMRSTAEIYGTVPFAMVLMTRAACGIYGDFSSAH